MKKLFTFLAAAAVSFSMMAADFQLYFGDEPVTPGATYKSYAEVALSEPDWGLTNYVVNSNLFFHGDAGTKVTMTVTADANVAVCWPSECKMSKDITVTGALNADAASAKGESIEVHYEVDVFDPDVLSDVMKKPVTLNVSAYAGNDASKAVTVTVILMNEETNAVKSIDAPKDFVRLEQGNVLNYSVQRPATLQLYAITGSLVAKYPLQNAGSIDLGGLPKGIYIYTDGAHKGKIVIR